MRSERGWKERLASVASLRCLITQLICCLVVTTAIYSFLSHDCPKNFTGVSPRLKEIQEEINSYRLHLENDASLLRKINEHQRNVENLNAALSQRDALLEELNDELLSTQVKLNATLNIHSNNGESGDENSGKDGDAKAEKEISDHQGKNSSIIGTNQLTREAAPVGIAVLVIADNNVKELRKTLESVTKNVPATGFPIFVCQHEGEEDITKLINSFLSKEGKNQKLYHLLIEADDVKDSGLSSFSRDSRLHEWALGKLFDDYAYTKVAVLNDYVDVAFDFYDYLQATAKLLDIDSTFMCVSGWNDNGQADFAKDSGSLYRTDVFPDFAWMINIEFWRELKKDWPDSDWKVWLRNREGNKGRSCLIPEVCRVSVRKRPLLSKEEEQFYELYLSKIKLNKNPITFADMDLGFLKKKNYDSYISQLVESSTMLESAAALKDYRGKPGDLRLSYKDTSSYLSVARTIGLPHVLKGGHPMASYQGIVIVRHGTWRVFVTPNDWKERIGVNENSQDVDELGVASKPVADTEV